MEIRFRYELLSFVGIYLDNIQAYSTQETICDPTSFRIFSLSMLAVVTESDDVETEGKVKARLVIESRKPDSDLVR